jgi:chemotaxis protein MotB
MAPRSNRGRNEPEPRPIIVKKVVVEAHGGHHGGQWKVAYADFVTAMMAFFLLLWLLNTTDEQKKKGLAEYFTPTLMDLKRDSAGSDGVFGGDSPMVRERHPAAKSSNGQAAIVLPATMGSKLSPAEAEALRRHDRARFEKLRKALVEKMDRTPSLRRLKDHVRFSESPDGLRIDLVDEADFSMFKIGTDRLLPPALNLVREVATVIATVPNEVIVRGHTDALPYAAGQTMNNWMLSTARAEATRSALNGNGIAAERFARIEGVADREPYAPEDLYDPRNRRMSITLAWSKGG